jgi:hypothetical protein
MTFQQIIDSLRRDIAKNRPIQGPGIRLAQTPVGTQISAVAAAGGAGSAATVFPVKITGIHPNSPLGSGVRVYRGDVYGDPKAAAKITAATIQCLQIAGGEVIPVNTWAIATKISSTWTKADATTITEPVYWIQAPIWL